MAWVGLDIGAKRTGVAISESGHLSRPLGLLTGTIQEQIKQLQSLIIGHEPLVIVTGSARTPEHPIALFNEALHKDLPTSLNVQYATVDEALTSKEAERLGGKNSDSDQLAAQLILEQYLREAQEGFDA